MRNAIRNAIAIAIAIFLLSVPAVVVRVSYDIALVGAGPAIEQLRSDMARITGAASEDVMGQATSWNQKIQSLRAYNSRWWGDPFIPDGWNRIAVLPIPRKE